MIYSVKDGNGEEFIVEEKPGKDECGAGNPDVKKDADPEKKPGEEKHDEASIALDEQEIIALKKLASVADKLVGLIPADEDPAVADEEKTEPIDDEEPGKEENKKGVKDSAGSVETKHTKTKDSLEDRESEICNEWAKKYAKFTEVK